jgi:hypothetical protein
LILGARSKRKAMKLVNELTEYFGTHADDIKELETLNPRGFYIDITSIVPQPYLSHLGKKSRLGANCHGYCTFGRLTSAGLSFSSSDLDVVTRPPLSMKVSKVSLMHRGDIVVLKDRDIDGNSITNLVHSFQYISKNLAIVKNGINNQNPFRIVDINEAVSVYENSAYDMFAEIFRLPTTNDIVAKYYKSHPQLIRDLKKLDVIERQTADFLVQENYFSLRGEQQKAADIAIKKAKEVAETIYDRYQEEHFEFLDYSGQSSGKEWDSYSEKQQIRLQLLALIHSKTTSLLWFNS